MNDGRRLAFYYLVTNSDNVTERFRTQVDIASKFKVGITDVGCWVNKGKLSDMAKSRGIEEIRKFKQPLVIETEDGGTACYKNVMEIGEEYGYIPQTVSKWTKNGISERTRLVTGIKSIYWGEFYEEKKAV